MIRITMILLGLAFFAQPAFAEFYEAEGAAPVESELTTTGYDTNAFQPEEEYDNGAFSRMGDFARGDTYSCEKERDYCEGVACQVKFMECMKLVQGAVN